MHCFLFLHFDNRIQSNLQFTLAANYLFYWIIDGGYMRIPSQWTKSTKVCFRSPTQMFCLFSRSAYC